MQCEIGLIQSENRVLIKNFEAQDRDEKMVELSDLSDYQLQLLLFNSQNISDEIKEALLIQSKNVPIRDINDFNIQTDEFTNLTIDQAREFSRKSLNAWILNNNISLMDELFDVSTHLKNLWPNDRTTFFEELWSLIKNNLGSSELTIIYNDIIKAKKEGEKNKLIQSKVHGKRKGNPQETNESEKKLLKDLSQSFQNTFEVLEYDIEKSQVMISAIIQKSPILILAKGVKMTKIQEKLLKLLIESLSI